MSQIQIKWAGPVMAVVLLLQMLPETAQAHGLRLAFMEAIKGADGTWSVAIRVPGVGDKIWPLGVHFPDDCVDLVPPSRTSLQSGDVMVRRTVSCQESSAPTQVSGLESGIVDLLVRLEDAKGGNTVALVTAASPSFVLSTTDTNDRTGISTLTLGFEHILTGYDHLAFVAGIVLLLQRWRNVLIAVTAFTLAHSVTLGLAVLGVVALPGPPVETVIALSIVYLAVEVIKRRREPDSSSALSRVWIAALGFGLLHGFGFAGALQESGIPEGQVLSTLALFNLGIELGQLAFVAILAGLLALAQAASSQARTHLEMASAYGLGCVASFWTIERLSAFF